MVLKEMLGEVPHICGEKIQLRALREEDALELYKYYSKEKVYRYLDWHGPKDEEHAKEIIFSWKMGFSEGWILRLAIATLEEDKLIGTIFLNNFEGKRAEVGYELSEEYWRRGIMSEALNLILSIAFNRLNLVRVQAFASPENHPSRSLLLKSGFTEEGYLKQYECHYITGECKDMYIYGLIKEENHCD